MDNFMTGFMRGYGFVDDVKSRHLDRERQTKLDAEAGEDRKLLRERLAQDDARQEASAAFTEEARGRQRDEWANQDNLRRLDAFKHRFQKGDAFTPEDVEWAQQNREKLGLPQDFFDPAKRQAMKQLYSGALQGLASGNLSKAQAVEFLNTAYADQINRGEGGQKRIIDMIPGPDGQSFIPELAVTNEQGEYRAPLTVDRGTDPNAAVKAIPMRQILEDVATRYQILASLDAAAIGFGDRRPIERQEQAEAARQTAAAAEHERGRDMQEFRQQEAYKSQLSREEKKEEIALQKELERVKGRSGSHTPAEIQTAEWLIHNKVATDAADAWEKVRQAKVNPAKLAVDIANAIYKADGLMSGEPYDAYLKRAQEYVAGLSGAPQGPGNNDPNDPLGLRSR